MLAMSRRKVLPAILSRVNPVTKSPAISVWATGLIIALLVLTGDITFTWSFSAFTVLIYYAITNLSSWMLDKEQRLYPRSAPACGFLGCLFLMAWIEPGVWISGGILLGSGQVWHAAPRRK